MPSLGEEEIARIVTSARVEMMDEVRRRVRGCGMQCGLALAGGYVLVLLTNGWSWVVAIIPMAVVAGRFVAFMANSFMAMGPGIEPLKEHRLALDLVEAIGQRPPRPVLLVLRSFDHEHMLRDYWRRAWTLLLARVRRRRYPFWLLGTAAIASMSRQVHDAPGAHLPVLKLRNTKWPSTMLEGTASLAVADTHWQDVVLALARRSSAIAILVEDGTAQGYGLRWELELVAAHSELAVKTAIICPSAEKPALRRVLYAVADDHWITEEPDDDIERLSKRIKHVLWSMSGVRGDFDAYYGARARAAREER